MKNLTHVFGSKKTKELEDQKETMNAIYNEHYFRDEAIRMLKKQVIVTIILTIGATALSVFLDKKLDDTLDNNH